MPREYASRRPLVRRWRGRRPANGASAPWRSVESRVVCSAPLARAPTPAESSSPGNARPESEPGPARPRAAQCPPRDRDRAGLEAPAAAVGPQPPPDVLVPRELPGGPRPRVHRPLQPARRRRARPVLRPRHRAAPGARRGPDRRRQRPQPAGPGPDRRQGRARRCPPRRAPASRPSASPGTPTPPPGSPSASGSWRVPATRRRPCPGPDRVAGPTRATRPSPTRWPSRSTRGRSASCSSSGASSTSTTASTASSRARSPGMLHGKTPSYLSTIMPNTF